MEVEVWVRRGVRAFLDGMLNRRDMLVSLKSRGYLEMIFVEQKPYIAEDLLKMKWVGTPRLSPCGGRIVFTVSEVLEKENAYASSLWMYDCLSNASRQITYRGGSLKGRDSNPKWSPNGKMIAFLSDRAGSSNQIFIMDMAGGEARQVTGMPKGAADFDWLDDGTLVCSAKEDADVPKLREGATARRITKLRYKFNGTGYLDGLKTQLWRVPIDGSGAGPRHACRLNPEQEPDQNAGRDIGQCAGGRAKDGFGPGTEQATGFAAERLTDGPYDCGSPVASPSGKYVAFTSNRAEDEMALYSDLYVLETATGKMIKITASLGHAVGPVFAPDESAVYYIGHEKGQSYPGVYPEIWKADLNMLERKAISGKFPYLVGGGIGGDVGPDSGKSGLSISACGRYLYFTAADGGSSYLFRLEIDSGEWERVCGEGQMVVKSYDMRGGKLVVNKSTPVTAGDLWYGSVRDACRVEAATEDLTGKLAKDDLKGDRESAARDTTTDGLTMVAEFNSELAAQRYAGWPEPVTFKHPDGTALEGWVILPKGCEAGKKYPLIMEIHGGPHTTYGNVFFHEFQMLAGHGFGVFYTNPRGSMGYGEEFSRAVVGDWCGVDARDLEFMAKEALSTFDWVDPKKFGVTGGSQGGYFTNWLIGHTDLFAAAVTQRSMSNLYSKYGVSDIGWSGDRAGMGGKDLWEHEDFIMERSPIRYAPNVKTPTLIIHSDQDYRCPLEQGEQWYVALKRLGVETEMLLFHGENHELSRNGKPANRIVRLEAILEWFERFMVR